jgi:hypothetical protein
MKIYNIAADFHDNPQDCPLKKNNAAKQSYTPAHRFIRLRILYRQKGLSQRFRQTSGQPEALV